MGTLRLALYAHDPDAPTGARLQWCLESPALVRVAALAFAAELLASGWRVRSIAQHSPQLEAHPEMFARCASCGQLRPKR